MRARRIFQPSVDLLPLRLAPSSTGVQVSPMDATAGAGTQSATIMVSPMDPTAGCDDGASVTNPTAAGAGSYTTPSTTTLVC